MTITAHKMSHDLTAGIDIPQPQIGWVLGRLGVLPDGEDGAIRAVPLDQANASGLRQSFGWIDQAQGDAEALALGVAAKADMQDIAILDGPALANFLILQRTPILFPGFMARPAELGAGPDTAVAVGPCF